MSFQKAAIIFSWGVILLAIIVGMVSITIQVSEIQTIEAAPFTYSQDIFLPENPDVCGGDVLRVPAKGVGVGGDEVVIIVDTFLREEGTLVRNASNFSIIHVPANDRSGQEVEITIEVPVPDYLSEGNYLVSHANSTLNSRSSSFLAPFSIISCEKE